MYEYDKFKSKGNIAKAESAFESEPNRRLRSMMSATIAARTPNTTPTAPRMTAEQFITRAILISDARDGRVHSGSAPRIRAGKPQHHMQHRVESAPSTGNAMLNMFT